MASWDGRSSGRTGPSPLATVDDRWHVELIVLLVGVWPYTHLVHAWHAVAEALVARRPGGTPGLAAPPARLGSPPAG